MNVIMVRYKDYKTFYKKRYAYVLSNQQKTTFNCTH